MSRRLSPYRQLLALALSCALVTACTSNDVESDELADSGAASDASLPLYVDAPNWTILGPGVAGGGQPDMDSLDELRAKGYTTVINLRRPGESFPEDEAQRMAAAGIDYHHLPIDGAHVGLADAWELDSILKQAQGGNVLIHCGSGNRVGGLWGLYQAMDQGLSADDAIDLAERSGLRSSTMAEQIRSELKLHESN